MILKKTRIDIINYKEMRSEKRDDIYLLILGNQKMALVNIFISC